MNQIAQNSARGSQSSTRESATADATNNNLVQAPTISLPTGGGAIRGIDEKFQVNQATGAGAMTIPIATSPARQDFGPQLALSYDSNAGNGPFGLGWSFSLPSIMRKTDKGLPQYRDETESDVYLLSGAEDLVPVLTESAGTWQWEELPLRTIGDQTYVIQRYRPRIEGLFARVERWTNSATGVIHWRSITRDNVTTLYGTTIESRIADPTDPEQRIFQWLIAESYDDKGNAICYEYRAEDGANVDLSKAHERNRTAAMRTANRYLKRIHYGNTVPYQPGEDLSLRDDWTFEVIFDYGEGHLTQSAPDDRGREFVQADLGDLDDWPVRLDPFSSYRAGFEVRTYRLCQRILMLHHFDELDSGEYLARSTEFTYAEGPILTYLTAATQAGYTRAGDMLPNGTARYLCRSLPPVEFEYSQVPLQNGIQHDDATALSTLRVQTIAGESLENLPAGLSAPYQFVDLDGEGLSGILTEQGNGWHYKPNLGDGHFGPLQTLNAIPSLAALDNGRQQLLDLAGDGQLDLAFFNGPTPGFYERTTERGWSPFQNFVTLPNLDWRTPHLRFIDLSGDGHADLLLTDDNLFTWYPSLAEAGFDAPFDIVQPWDEEAGPRLVLNDSTQSVYLSDMSGDGLTDLVRIRNGEVCYWPNLGYGRFGSKVTMDNAPRFDAPNHFNPQRIRLADIDGSGIADIIYLGSGQIDLYYNQSGNGWSQRDHLPFFPNVDALSDVQVVDLLGNGTACLVWSSPLPGDAGCQLRYVDLMNSTKPHLLIRARNNLGAETTIAYAPSTKFYLEDQAAGHPWITRLPFPVYVVERVETYDQISHNRFVTRYAYHHGYFDGVEREFRGFGLVEQWDTEEFSALNEAGEFPLGENIDASSHVPPVLTRTWFHTGTFLDRDNISRLFADDYYSEPGLDADQQAALLLPDTLLPSTVTLPAGAETAWELTTQEVREACRALRGAVLRQEVYGLDGSADAAHPYTVAERNYTLKLLQPKANNKHAIFFHHPREEVTYHHERQRRAVAGQQVADPRVSHQLTLAVDEYGNVEQAVAVGYGRRHRSDDPLLTIADQAEQSRIYLILTDNHYTNAVQTDDVHRARLIAEARTFELHNVDAPTSALLRFGEVIDTVAAASDGAHDLPFEDVDAAGVIDDQPHRRLVEYVRTLYRPDDLGAAAGDVNALLAPGVLESRALAGEAYRLALTPGLLDSVYGERLPDATRGVIRDEGGYVDLDGDGRWWISSGRVFYSPDTSDNAIVELAHAETHFFLPHRYRDPFGETTHVAYDRHNLLTVETVDPLGNSTRADHDYRVLLPALVTDANGNRAAAAFDALGMIVGTAVMGKDGENLGDSLDGFVADLDETTIQTYLADPLADPHAILARASTRLVYDLHAYTRTARDAQPQPAVVYTLVRETHDADLADGEQTRVQHRFSYSDGFGREIQQIMQAEPGPLAEDGPEVDPRWTVSGWTIFNNKGKPVRQYEPFFSDTHRFQFGVQVGVSPILFYDPVERVVATLHPNHTWEKTVFDPWQQRTWDVNDTVLLDPAADPDVGDFFRRLPDDAHQPTWHNARIGGAFGADEEAAANKAAAHSDTPTIAHFDALGRTFLSVADNSVASNGGGEQFTTRTEYDIEGKPLAVTDALDRTVMAYTVRDDANRRRSGYDVAGNLIFQQSIDAGARWLLMNVTGKPLRAWDERGHTLRTVYDALQRPIEIFVADAGGEHLVQRTVYGEAQGDAQNHRGQIFQHFDGAGVITNEAFDFKGNLLRSTRQFTTDYGAVPDWSINPSLTLDAFTSQTTYDARNRAVALTTPDNSVVRPRYNEANLLEAVDVNLRGDAVATNFVENLDYDAKGQRQRILYGNGVETRYDYDPQTFRLTRLQTTRGVDSLQDLHYVYDPGGNITSIRDDAQQSVYFNNDVVEPRAAYVYDALYRLIEATGREHIGQVGQPQQTSWNDEFRTNLLHPEDGSAMRRYTETYAYDGVGNILELIHTANNGNWTRTYAYNEASQLDATAVNNRLSETTVGGDVAPYAHDAHGNMTSMPHLAQMDWDYADRLQQVDLGGGGTAFYQYDGAGQRVRKVIERQNGTRSSERLYLGGFERFQEFNGAGDVVTLERETLHVMDNQRRIALIETRTQGDDGSVAQLIRYQLGNHLDSASLELDDAAQVISYEEYYPYGSTSYQAVRNAVQVPPKRYRYTGKERDEETGLNYHGARYYAPWLGRWTSADPAGLVDGPNLYRYVRNNPIRLNDPTGTDPPDDDPAVRVTPLLTQVTPLGISGQAQFHDLFSADRSVSGRLALSGQFRSSFILDVPPLSLHTTGFADLSGTAAVDTSLGRGGVHLQGGLLLGDISGLNLAARGEGTFRIPVPDQIRLGDAQATLLSALPQAEGNLQLHGALSFGSLSLTDFHARASLAEGQFTGRLSATTIGNIGQLRLDATGTLGATGDVTLDSARLRATIDIPGVNLDVRGTGTGTSQGGLDVNATADLRLLGLPSLHAEGSGTVSTAGAEFAGQFSGAGPLYTSYITGRFQLSTESGISASAGVFGLTYSPSASVTDPAPPSPGLRALAGDPAEPWSPSGLTLGASFFNYSQGNFNYISAGFMPDLSERILTNPRFGVTSQWHF